MHTFGSIAAIIAAYLILSTIALVAFTDDPIDWRPLPCIAQCVEGND